jgi:hypothetical protein
MLGKYLCVGNSKNNNEVGNTRKLTPLKTNDNKHSKYKFPIIATL